MTVKEALKYSADFLKNLTDEAENEAKLIVSHLIDEPISRLFLSVKTVDKTALYELLSKRAENIPIQYIIGKWWFYKGEYFVGEGVLIPRQDTETLVETAAELLKEKTAPSVADLCSGSGCIAISIAQDYPEARVTAVEKYEKAFSYLEMNIKHNAAENVIPVLADVCGEPFGSYDLIVSNPPYITAVAMKELSKEVKKEPETALFGGEDGLYFYNVIAEKWKAALKPKGVLAFEIGYDEAEAVSEILRKNGYSNITVKQDLCGHQRVVFGTVNNI